MDQDFKVCFGQDKAISQRKFTRLVEMLEVILGMEKQHFLAK